jgi:hypothetical protein
LRSPDVAVSHARIDTQANKVGDVSDTAQVIVDLLVDRFIGDLHFPLMSRTAWQTKLRCLLPPINAIIDETIQEARSDTLRESTVD